jgi:DNA repair protein SbcD/Mre11
LDKLLPIYFLHMTPAHRRLKILHTADWHLGKYLYDFSRLEEQRQVLAEIEAIALEHQVDIVLIAGDIYDISNPPVEAIELLHSSLKNLNRNGQCPIFAIAGNHDSPERIDAQRHFAAELGIFMLGLPDQTPYSASANVQLPFAIAAVAPGFICIELPSIAYPIRLILTPYANASRLRRWLLSDEQLNQERDTALAQQLQNHWQQHADAFCDEKGVNILVTHLMMMPTGSPLPDETDGEKPISVGGAPAIPTQSIPHSIQYTALGHIHSKMAVKAAEHPFPAYYCGSPLAYSTSEAGHTKTVLLVEIAPGEQPTVTPIPLQSGKPIERHTFLTVDAALQWMEQHPNCWLELTMQTPHYLTTQETKALHQAHSGILAIIPHPTALKKPSGLATDSDSSIQTRIQKPIAELFVDYFQSEKKQAPSPELMQLLQEVLAHQQTLHDLDRRP